MPELVVVRSPYREFRGRLLEWLRRFRVRHPDRDLIVLIPELVQRRWYRFMTSRRTLRLRAALIMSGDPRPCVMATPWYSDGSGR